MKHLLISTVRGEFGKTEGTVIIDPTDLTKSTVEATIDVASIDTRDEKRDEHLRSAGLLRRGQVPQASPSSPPRSRRPARELKVTGDLTMHGVTKSVVLDVTGPTAEIKDP